MMKMLQPIRDLDPTLLRAFIAIVDTGNFSRAAARLNRTQSALSMQVKRLEELLDASLFDRASRPPTLTMAGEKLVAYAREIIAINDSALEDIRSETVSGQVRLGIMEDFAATRLAPLLGRFRQTYPGVHVEIETGLTAEFVEMLGCRFDIVVAMTAVGSHEGELLYRGKTRWAGAQGFDPRRWEVLPIALFPPGCLFRKWATTALDRAGRKWRTSLVSTSFGAVSAVVRDGWCVSLFKDFTMPPDLRALGPADGMPALPDFEIRLLRTQAADTGAGKALSAFLRANLSEPHLSAENARRKLSA